MFAPSHRLIAACIAAFSLLAPGPGLARDTATTQTKETQVAISADDAIAMLKAGNERFVTGEMLKRDLRAQVAATAGGQYPFAVVLGCIDSRVPPEIVFDQGIGDIFAPRIAGNFVNTDILGSMEFATAVAGSRAIVVLGHTDCGAIKGACDGVELGNLTHTLSNLAPAVYTTPSTTGERTSKNTAFVNAVTHTNVKLTVQNILDRSPVIRSLVDQGKVKVVGAIHDVGSGRVSFLD